MVSIKAIPSLARPGLKPKYPKTGQKKKNETIMDKANKKAEQLLGMPKSLSVTKRAKVKMPKSSRY